MERHTDLEVKYNSRTGRVRRLNLEKLSKPVADFVKHLNFVFSGTPYGIKSVNEYRGSVRDETKPDYTHIGIALYKLGEEPAKKCSDGYGYIGVTFGGWCDKPNMSILYYEDKNKHAVNIKKFESQIRNYDLTSLIN
jgi:hypothetical protein